MSKVILQEEATTPSTPATGKWAIYTKSDGFYILDDQGTESGPFESITSAEQTKLSHITVSQAVDLDTMESDIATNNAKVSNATHTGDVTGSTALTLDSVAITGKTTVTPVAGDFFLISDTSDSGNLKKIDASTVLGGGGSDTINVQTLAGNKTLTNADDVYQILDPNGTSRNVTLPAEEADLRFVITNFGTSSSDLLPVLTDQPSNIFTLGPCQTALFVCDGTSWYTPYPPQGYTVDGNGGVSLGPGAKATGISSISIGTGASSSTSNSIAIGYLSTVSSTGCIAIGNQINITSSARSVVIGADTPTAPNNDAVVIGYSADAGGDASVIIGASASSSGSQTVLIGSGASTTGTTFRNVLIGKGTTITTTDSVAIGNTASVSGAESISVGSTALASGTDSVALGYGTDATQTGAIAIGHEAQATVARGIALGASSQVTRAAELTMNTGSGADVYSRGNIGLSLDTTTTTPSEMFCGLESDGLRLTIKAESVFAFDAIITGRDNTTGNCCVYRFSGAIKRDGANNTALVGTPFKEVLGEDDAGFDCSVAADDTNDALVFTVTAAAANTTQWSGSVDFAETQF